MEWKKIKSAFVKHCDRNLFGYLNQSVKLTCCMCLMRYIYTAWWMQTCWLNSILKNISISWCPCDKNVAFFTGLNFNFLSLYVISLDELLFFFFLFLMFAQLASFSPWTNIRWLLSKTKDFRLSKNCLELKLGLF